MRQKQNERMWLTIHLTRTWFFLIGSYNEAVDLIFPRFFFLHRLSLSPPFFSSIREPRCEQMLQRLVLYKVNDRCHRTNLIDNSRFYYKCFSFLAQQRRFDISVVCLRYKHGNIITSSSTGEKQTRQKRVAFPKKQIIVILQCKNNHR